MPEDGSMKITTLEYPYVFDFEKSYSYTDTKKWLTNNLVYFYSSSIVYFIVIISARVYMLNKPKYNLKLPFAIWCGLNALFSAFGFIRTVPELFFALRYRSLYYSVCLASNYFQNPVSGFWIWALVLSKIVQLCDTIFIVLQKEQVTFLHVYRHLTIIPYYWFTYMQTAAIMRWFSVIDYFVHLYMYSYYTLKILKFILPKYFAVLLIVMQLTQTMINGIIIVMAYDLRDSYKLDCDITFVDAVVGSIYCIINSYFYTVTIISTYKNKKNENKYDKKIKKRVH